MPPFFGWETETDAPVFAPQTVTMFDLRTPQRGGVTFFYILKFSPTNALVRLLLRNGQKVRASLRSPDQRKTLDGRGVRSKSLQICWINCHRVKPCRTLKIEYGKQEKSHFVVQVFSNPVFATVHLFKHARFLSRMGRIRRIFSNVFLENSCYSPIRGIRD